MDEIYDYFQKICNLLEDKVQKIITEPLFWVMLFLLLCCIVLAYSGTSQGRLSSSIISTLRQPGSFFIDTFNSIIQACKSLFGFLEVLKMLFFGHLNSSTLYILTNYAIIFLSMASFSTTMQGLFSLIGWTGILISFGVQVMELVTTMGIIICYMPLRGKMKEMVVYAPYQPDESTPYRHVKNYVESVLEPEEDSKSTGGGAAGGEVNVQKKSDDPGGGAKEKKRIWIKPYLFRDVGKCAALVLFLALSYVASSTFSYCYIFDAVVMPEIAYDDYIESIDLVNGNIEKFEGELSEYRAELVGEMSKLNGDISTYHNFAAEDFSALEANIQNAQKRYDEAVGERDQIDQKMDRFEDIDDPDYIELSEKYRKTSDDIRASSSELEDLRKKESSGEDALFKAIQLLDQYYADPLYLTREKGDIDAAEAEVMHAYTAVMTQGLDPYKEDIEVDEDSFRTAFNNYKGE